MTNPITPNPNLPPSGGGGMPKWLIILIVVGIVVVLGCCGGLTTCWYFAHKAVQAVPGFMQNQLQKNGVNVNLNGSAISLPANFPSDVPVYSGFTPIESVSPPGQNQTEVTFRGKGSPQKIADYYASELKDKGWTLGQSSAQADVATQAFTKDDQQLSIIVSGNDDAATIVMGYGKK